MASVAEAYGNWRTWQSVTLKGLFAELGNNSAEIRKGPVFAGSGAAI